MYVSMYDINLYVCMFVCQVRVLDTFFHRGSLFFAICSILSGSR